MDLLRKLHDSDATANRGYPQSMKKNWALFYNASLDSSNQINILYIFANASFIKLTSVAVMYFFILNDRQFIMKRTFSSSSYWNCNRKDFANSNICTLARIVKRGNQPYTNIRTRLDLTLSSSYRGAYLTFVTFQHRKITLTPFLSRYYNFLTFAIFFCWLFGKRRESYT